MFLLNGLYKYFAMNTSFRISLLYLLFIIPQHGNTPLPVKESWLQKDQDDGFVQQDMTSSLTGGDESFGSAHQTYQNSLIRKKKSDILENQLPNSNYVNYPSKFDVNQQFEQPNSLYDAQYLKKEFIRPIDDIGLNSMYEGYDSVGPSYNPYLPEIQNLRNPADDPSFSHFMNTLSDSPAFFNTNMRVLNGRLNLRAEAERNLNPINEGIGRNTKWTMCKRLKARYAPNPFVELSQPLEDRNSRGFDENIPLQNDYLPLEDEQTGPEFTNEEYKDVNRRESKNSQIFDENEYYDTETNPVMGEDDVEGNDYSQILNEHAYMHKRDEAKQLDNNQKAQASQSTKVVIDTLKAPDFGRTYFSDPSLEDNSAHIRSLGSETRDVNNLNMNGIPDSDLVWKLTSDYQTKELNNVMRNSQRALQEAKQLQQKMSYKQVDSNENEGVKRQSRSEPLMRYENKNMNFDEKRLKREDEDEQKNMKTGTDEGGGEYEDEEGKGHKDEEEYYEEADLTEDDFGNEIQKIDNLNQKYVKRETTEGKTQTNPNNPQYENNSQDYELNLENAPIENAERSRKTSYREGEKTKKSVRKGVKIWDQWGKWSPCSVTCGVGRSTRWRHCIGGGCAQGEKEAQIKRCTNPACR